MVQPRTGWIGPIELCPQGLSVPVGKEGTRKGQRATRMLLTVRGSSGPNCLQRLTDKLRTTLSLLDSEQLSFDFKSEKNDTHLRPEFIERNTGSNHDLPHDSKPEDYFGLFYTDELMQQVSVVL